MGKIYTIVIVSKSIQRETKLASLLSSDEIIDIPFEYLWSKNGRLLKEISLKIKVYKTLSGANRECYKINKKYSGKLFRLNKGHYVDGKWTNLFTFDNSQYSFIVIDIKDKWNIYIDSEIEKEKSKYINEFNKLNSLKV